MGYSCKPENVMLCLSALGSVLSDMGLPVHVGEAEGGGARRLCGAACQGGAGEKEKSRVSNFLSIIKTAA